MKWMVGEEPGEVQTGRDKMRGKKKRQMGPNSAGSLCGKLKALDSIAHAVESQEK